MYEHRQVGWLTLLAFMATAVLLAQAFRLSTSGGTGGVAVPLMLLMSVILLACTVIFSSLTTRVTPQELQWHFGPGWPKWRVPLADVVNAEHVQPPWWWGYGIRMTPHGWMYNVSGRNGVLIMRRNGKSVIVGTDDPAGLIAAITGARNKPHIQP